MGANLFIAALAGLVGAIVLTLLLYLLKLFGQDLDIPYLIGSLFVDINKRAQVYVVGILIHLLVGAGWGVLYVILLTAMVVTPNWPAGILWGFAHGIFVGSMMGIIADTHPYIGENNPIKSPGILAEKWGTLMPYWILGLHIVFGVCTLLIYHQWITT
jgi:hypothetical protein